MKMPPCPATSGSWQVLKVLGDGGSGEGPSFKKGLPPKMHFHRNANQYQAPSTRMGTLQKGIRPRVGSASFAFFLVDFSLDPA